MPRGHSVTRGSCCALHYNLRPPPLPQRTGGGWVGGGGQKGPWGRPVLEWGRGRWWVSRPNTTRLLAVGKAVGKSWRLKPVGGHSRGGHERSQPNALPPPAGGWGEGRGGGSPPPFKHRPGRGRVYWSPSAGAGGRPLARGESQDGTRHLEHRPGSCAAVNVPASATGRASWPSRRQGYAPCGCSRSVRQRPPRPSAQCPCLALTRAGGHGRGGGVVGAAGESNDWHYDAPDCQALPNPLSRVRLGLCTQQCRQRAPPQARSGWSAKEGPTEPGRTTGEWGGGGHD